MTHKPRIKGKSQPQKSTSVLHLKLHMLTFQEDLAAHLNSRYAYPDNVPKKGRGRQNKRNKLQNLAYANEINNFRRRAMIYLRMPLKQPDMFSGGGSTGCKIIHSKLFIHYNHFIQRVIRD